MVDLNPLQMGLEFGGGGVLGFLIGYATKKVAKVIAIIIGAELVLFKFLETKGVLKVDWGALASTAENATQTGAEAASTGQGYFVSLVSALPIGVGFAGGAILGFKRG